MEKDLENSLTYSFVVPIYNDGYLVEAFCKEFYIVFREFLKSKAIDSMVELIFVNDGSVDDSQEQLEKVARIHNFVKVIDLSRNFGQHVALISGYQHASGKYVGRLNVDMQDPPKEIPNLINEIHLGNADMVVGVQRKRQSKWLDRVTSRLFVWVFNYLIGGQIPLNTSSLRIMTRAYAENYSRIGDKFPFIQGLDNWFGCRISYLPIEHLERIDEKSSYTFIKRLRLALDAAIAFSDRPLKVTINIGLLFVIAGFVGISLIIARKILAPNIAPGYSSTTAIILFCSGMQIFVIGVSGLYIGKILAHCQNRPLYLVRSKLNFRKQ